jgi:hypothetical protein
MPDQTPTFQEFVQIYGLSPIVRIKRACEIEGCGHSKLYKLRQDGLIRIVSCAGGSGVPAIDLYNRHVAAMRSVEAA